MFKGVDPFVISVWLAVMPDEVTTILAIPSLIAAMSSMYAFVHASEFCVGAPRLVNL